MVAGVPVGRTPHKLTWPIGSAAPAVRLEKSGYDILELDLSDVKPGSKLKLRLQPLSAPPEDGSTTRRSSKKQESASGRAGSAGTARDKAGSQPAELPDKARFEVVDEGK